MTAQKKHRLAILTSHVIQYQDPLFAMLGQHPEIELTVLYCSDTGARKFLDRDMNAEVKWDTPVLEGYRYKFLRNFSPFDFQRGFLRLINPGAGVELIKGEYDAVIVMLGWASVTSWISFAAATARSLPFFMYGDSNYIPPADTPRGRARETLLRRLFAITTGFMITGQKNADYYLHYGADRSRFFPMPWAVDNERFSRSGRLSPETKNVVRDHLGIPRDRVVLLFSAKLVERKDPATLLRAVAAMQHHDRVSVVFAGDGILREELAAEAKRLRVDAHFPGFINQTALPEVYGMSDVFVLPSCFEPRGAVVNEAMACALPVVVSDAVGSAGDIAQHEVNGFVFRVGDHEQLAGFLDRLLADPLLREKMGQKSAEIISTWDYRADVEGVLQALRWVETAQAARRKR